eukprot:TRINITY_DN20535_c0_g1_i1.p1 TRINITY_DN20535_c0_g1~~TRINITY_DN20535_c0_g1_i1.p1  ORF type:complete len:119 (-),score=14.69 TRINITY_DN20535_c0_g1_i1:136-492(-)
MPGFMGLGIVSSRDERGPVAYADYLDVTAATFAMHQLAGFKVDIRDPMGIFIEYAPERPPRPSPPRHPRPSPPRHPRPSPPRPSPPRDRTREPDRRDRDQDVSASTPPPSPPDRDRDR